ncbi:probable linoleate 9S-lipoxygenase 5, partial [Tanacetum coccineum]
MEAPGAFLVQNKHHSEFYLKTLTLDDVPGHGKVHFVCNSWVYPTKRYTKDRVFFTNKGKILHKKFDDARPVLGGSSEYPYPRRGRTGRPPTKSGKDVLDPNTESRLPLAMSLNIYVPRDERFGHLRLSDFLAYGLKSIVQFLVPELKALSDSTFDEFDSFEDVYKIYEGGFKLPQGFVVLSAIKKRSTWKMLKILLETDNNTGVARYPKPQIIQKDKYAWKKDAEFAREMLAGVNPVKISLLKEFPPTSKLDVQVYGNQNSSIQRHHIEQNLNGLKVEEVLKANRLFILDHHDSLMPYLRRINEGVNKIYASRTLLLLQEDGTLMPLTIELSLPHPEGDNFGPISNVYTPAQKGVEGSVWQLVKAYVAVYDSGIHKLINHWLSTHAVVEPFVIAANRQLSILHTIYKLLYPHFRDTMNINAFARQILINGGVILEKIE